MTWPAVAYEQVPWDAEPERASSRRQQLRARGPYRAAVPPFIAELSPSIPGLATENSQHFSCSACGA